MDIFDLNAPCGTPSEGSHAKNPLQPHNPSPTSNDDAPPLCTLAQCFALVSQDIRTLEFPFELEQDDMVRSMDIRVKRGDSRACVFLDGVFVGHCLEDTKTHEDIVHAAPATSSCHSWYLKQCASIFSLRRLLVCAEQRRFPSEVHLEKYAVSSKPPPKRQGNPTCITHHTPPRKRARLNESARNTETLPRTAREPNTSINHDESPIATDGSRRNADARAPLASTDVSVVQSPPNPVQHDVEEQVGNSPAGAHSDDTASFAEVINNKHHNSGNAPPRTPGIHTVFISALDLSSPTPTVVRSGDRLFVFWFRTIGSRWSFSFCKDRLQVRITQAPPNLDELGLTLRKRSDTDAAFGCKKQMHIYRVAPGLAYAPMWRFDDGAVVGFSFLAQDVVDV